LISILQTYTSFRPKSEYMLVRARVWNHAPGCQGPVASPFPPAPHFRGGAGLGFLGRVTRHPIIDALYADNLAEKGYFS
jgi:hypothetical protein